MRSQGSLIFLRLNSFHFHFFSIPLLLLRSFIIPLCLFVLSSSSRRASICARIARQRLAGSPANSRLQATQRHTLNRSAAYTEHAPMFLHSIKTSFGLVPFSGEL